MSIIGRELEINTLIQVLNSDVPEFLAIYGRRRVGKTYLIRSFFEKKNAYFFNSTGIKGGSLTEQIRHFTKEIARLFYGGAQLKEAKNWDLTFEMLTEAFKSFLKTKKLCFFLMSFRGWLQQTQNFCKF